MAGLYLPSICEGVAKRTNQQTEKGIGINNDPDSNGSGVPFMTHKHNDNHNICLTSKQFATNWMAHQHINPNSDK